MKKQTGQINYRTRGFKPKKSVVIAILALILAGCLAAGYFYYKSLSKFKFEEPAEYFINGLGYDINPGSELIIKDDGSVELNDDTNTAVSSYRLPVYFKDRDAVLLVNPMSYFKDGVVGYTRGQALELFTQLEMRSDNVLIKKGIKSLVANGAFLYDGDNSYVLLTDAQLSVGDRKISLSPLSYVIAAYDSWVIYYDHDTNTSEYIVFEDSVSPGIGDIDLKIDLENDLEINAGGLENIEAEGEESSDLALDDNRENQENQDNQDLQSISQSINKEITLEFESGLKVFCDLDRAESNGENFMLTPAVTMLPSAL